MKTSDLIGYEDAKKIVEEIRMSALKGDDAINRDTVKLLPFAIAKLKQVQVELIDYMAVAEDVQRHCAQRKIR